jgi:hypothetical protein
MLSGSNGQWTPVDPSLQMSVQPGSAGQLVISGNADLWALPPVSTRTSALR